MQAEHQNDTVGEGDLEEKTQGANMAWHNVRAKIRGLIGKIAMSIRNVQKTKLNHAQLLLLVEKFCNIIDALDHSEVEKAITQPLFLATKLGIRELVETIVMELPTAIWLVDKEKRNALQVAILNRHEKVFNIIYRMSHYRQSVTKHIDIFNNNVLHLAGKLAPLDPLNLVPGPALQMQRELQWFKAVELFVEPSYKDLQNSAGKTPLMVFIEEHRQLIKDGGEWMKEIAESCIVVALFIATVVYAARITFPGSNKNDNDLLVFSHTKSFLVFIMAITVSEYSSLYSVLMFFSILTTQYTIDNVLYTLPNKLSIALFTLFLSVTTMLIAFSATLFYVVATRKLVTLVPFFMLASLMISLFVFSQSPLLWVMLKSTYFSRGILRKSKK